MSVHRYTNCVTATCEAEVAVLLAIYVRAAALVLLCWACATIIAASDELFGNGALLCAGSSAFLVIANL